MDTAAQDLLDVLWAGVRNFQVFFTMFNILTLPQTVKILRTSCGQGWKNSKSFLRCPTYDGRDGRSRFVERLVARGSKNSKSFSGCSTNVGRDGRLRFVERLVGKGRKTSCHIYDVQRTSVGTDGQDSLDILWARGRKFLSHFNDVRHTYVGTRRQSRFVERLVARRSTISKSFSRCLTKGGRWGRTLKIC